MLLEVASRTRERLQELEPPVEVFDAWYLDDGELITEPNDSDATLRTLDEEAAKVGAFRAKGENAKSIARLA